MTTSHRLVARLARCRSGNAVVETALILPMLIALMFGAFELGAYFLSEHLVVKAVRDGARYAARRGFDQYSCPSTINADVIDKTRNLVRTGQVTSGGASRLPNWTTSNAGTTITVSLSCTAIAANNYSGIYRGMTAVPAVTVTANVPYQTLLHDVGMSSSTLSLRASSQATVSGI